jgi:hypothetical protein
MGQALLCSRLPNIWVRNTCCHQFSTAIASGAFAPDCRFGASCDEAAGLTRRRAGVVRARAAQRAQSRLA